MLHWIIFVLTLCTAIMSVVHGVFIVLGALPVSSGAYPALPQNIVTMMPIISAMIALIGGVIAFSRNKLSILFFLCATVACALGSQDVWLYGGVYFFAGIFCFFLRRKPQDPDYLSNYYVEEGDFSLDPGAELDPDDNANSVLLDQNNSSNRIFLNQKRNIVQNPNFDDDINEFKNDINFDTEQEQNQDSKSQVQISPVKIRGRTSKSCPTCGNIVARDVNYCPNCGTQLHMDPSLSFEVPPEESHESHEEFTIKNNPDNMPLDIKSEIPKLSIPEPTSEINNDSDSGDGTEENINNDFSQPNQQTDYRNNYQDNQHNPYNQAIHNQSIQSSEVLSYNSPTSISNLLEKNNNSNDNLSETESEQEVYKVSGANFAQRKNFSQKNKEMISYKEFANSKYNRRGKKRRSSSGKRILSMLMLIVAVGGALYFLLGLRKLPPGDLPPIAKDEIIPPVQENKEQDMIAQPVSENNNTTVRENILPTFTPEQNPKNGIITGNGVNMRTDHSLVARPVTKLNNNTRFEILDSWTGQTGSLSGTWYQVRTSNNREGWVYGRYVQLSGSGIPTGYSNALMKSFGSNKNELIESLGNPTRSTGSSAEWPGLTVTLRGDDITRVRVTSSNRELQNGLKTGINQDSLFHILGYPSARNSSQRTMQYNENGKAGINIQMDRNGIVTAITVNEVN